MIKISFYACLLVLFLVSCGEQPTQAEAEAEAEAEATTQEAAPKINSKHYVEHSKANAQTFGKGNNTFGVNFYKQLAKGKEGQNLLFSPVSLHLGLGMLYLGATEEGKKELEKVLALQNLENPANDYANFQKSQCAYIANALCASNKNDFQLKKGYQKKIEENFDAKFFVGDLSSPAFSREINEWISKSTKNHIKEATGVLSEKAGLVLISSIFFEDAWKEGNDFDGTKTKPDAFFVSPQARVAMPFMNKNEGFAGHFAHEKFQMVSLQHQYSRSSFYVILPDENVPLAEIEEMMTPQNLQAWIDSTSNKEIERLSIPKMSVDNDISAKEVLKAMGAKAIFDNMDARNFNEIANKPLFVGNIKQKTHLAIDEQGTTAASYTTTETRPTESKAPRNNKVNMLVNRPFIFFVYSKDNKSILFLGRFVRPTR